MSAHLGAEKFHPSHWEDEFGFKVTNPEGWTKRGIDWDRAITADAFLLMANDSGAMITDYPRLTQSGALELPWLTDQQVPAS